MTTFVESKLGNNDVVNPAALDLNDGPHDLVYSPNGQKLTVHNRESGSITVTLQGDGVTAKDIPLLGNTDVSAGKGFTIVSNAVEVIDLDEHAGWFNGNGSTVNVTITGASGESFGWLTRG